MANDVKNQGWDDISDTKKTTKKGGFEKSKFNNDLFMKLPDGEHKLRLVGKTPVKIHVAWIPSPFKKKEEKVGKTKEQKVKVIVPDAYIDRLKSINIIPRENFAMLCFDRKDTEAGITRLKILEKGPTVFRAFKTWAKSRAVDGVFASPGDKTKGPDWFIEANVPDNILETTYAVTALDASPFTKAEATLLTRKPSADDPEDMPLGERGPIDLKEYYEAEKEKSAKTLELFFKNNNSLDTTQSVEDFVSEGKVDSLDSLPEAAEEMDQSVADQLDSMF